MEDDGRQHGYETADPSVYLRLKAYAAENRSNQTAAEKMLWNELGNNRYGLKFRRQHIIDIFIADFVCLKYNLVIEVDGGYHSQSDQQVSDELRTKALAEEGFKVIRFTNEQIEADPKGIAEQIYDEIFNIEDSMDE
jgi:very-short-patch-repair endonuclease